MRRNIWILICAACGIFCALCFDTEWLAPFLWVALAPLFHVLLTKNEPLKKTLAKAAVFSLALCLFYYTQIFSLNVSSRAGESAGVALLLGWVGLSLLHGSVFTAALTAGARLKCPSFLRAPLIACLWAGAEWLIGAGALGLPCIRLGVTQWQFLPVTQSASVFGVIFVGMLLVLVNVLLAQSVLLRMRRGKAVWYAGAAALIFFANFVCGMIAINAQIEPEKTVEVAAVQFNVPFWKTQGEGRLEKAVAMAQSAANEKPALLFLPENTVYGSMLEEPELQEGFSQAAKEGDSYLFAGAYGFTGYKLRNSVFLFAPDGSVQGIYHKQRLVPFFENGFETEFSLANGTDRGIFETEYGAVGVVICFESLFPEITADTVRQGAQLLYVATNDSWFAKEIPLRRHFAQSVLRAQETGRWLVQAGNTGVTAIVSPQGVVTECLEENEDGILYGSVQLRKGQTPYLLIGDWWIAGAICVMALALLISGKKQV